MSLIERIDALLKERGSMTFNDLAYALYPEPRSWRYQANGGPPGCFMALSAAIRRGGFPETFNGPGPGFRRVFPRTLSTNPVKEQEG